MGGPWVFPHGPVVPGSVFKLRLRCRKLLGRKGEERRRGQGAGPGPHCESVMQCRRHTQPSWGTGAGLLAAAGPCMVYSVSNSDSDPSSVLTVQPRNFPWTTTLSMLYIDNPVSTMPPRENEMSVSMKCLCAGLPCLFFFLLSTVMCIIALQSTMDHICDSGPLRF